jgi:hypothetical protein
MTRLLFAVAGATLLFLATAPPVEAQERGRERGSSEGRQGGDRGGSRRSVPEFDPATAGAVAALIAGGGILLARRRKGP